MRRDDLYLNDIIEAADHIATFLKQRILKVPAIGVDSKRRCAKDCDHRGGRGTDL
jgi:hypothetical protein